MKKIDGKLESRKYGVMMTAASTKKKELSKSDLRRLAPFSDEYEFPKSSAQEWFAFDMFQAGLLERRWELYSVSAGRKTAQFRWSYRLTEEGCAALGREKKPTR